MAAPERHLRVIPGGQPEEITAEVQAFLDTIEGLERINKRLLRELAELKRDKQAAAEADFYWPLATRLFVYHGRLCNHQGDEWGWEQFELILPKLKGTGLVGRREDKERLGLERCLRAIAGAHFDPWRKPRRNKTYFVYNRWNDIFGRVPGKTSHFEDFIAKCPTDWKPPRGASEFLK